MLTRCSQLLNETCELDFIDINLGCPIDLVYTQVSQALAAVLYCAAVGPPVPPDLDRLSLTTVCLPCSRAERTLCRVPVLSGPSVVFPC